MSSPTRWLASYADDKGASRAAIIAVADAASFPFGVDDLPARLPDLNPGSTITLVEMPDDADFRPTIVDWSADEEAPLTFIHM